MRLAVVGDVHLISRDDPYVGMQRVRSFFRDARPSFERLIDQINHEGVDQVIFLGDLVDWFSAENIQLALDLVSRLKMPWSLVPGNHDIQEPTVERDEQRFGVAGCRSHMSYWEGQGVELANRCFDADGWNLILCDNSLSDIEPGTRSWLGECLDGGERNLLFSHVPIDLPVIRDYILSVDPNRCLGKYVLSSESSLHDDVLSGRIRAAFSGHLHFGGELAWQNCRLHLASMAITMFDPARQQGTEAEACIVELDRGGIQRRIIRLAQ